MKKVEIYIHIYMLSFVNFLLFYLKTKMRGCANILNLHSNNKIMDVF